MLSLECWFKVHSFSKRNWLSQELKWMDFCWNLVLLKVGIIKPCEKWLPLKWSILRERINFQRVWFWDLRFRIWGLEIKHLKAHYFDVTRAYFFLSLLSRNFDDRWSSNFHRFIILCICWDTASEKWSLTVTNSVHCL